MLNLLPPLRLLRDNLSDPSVKQHTLDLNFPSLLLPLFPFLLSSSDPNAFKVSLTLSSCLSNLLTLLPSPPQTDLSSFPQTYLLPLTITITQSPTPETNKRKLLSRIFASLHNLIHSHPQTSSSCIDSLFLSNILRHALPTSSITSKTTSPVSDECTSWITRLITLLISSSPSSLEIIFNNLISRLNSHLSITGESYVFLQILAGHIDELLLSIGYDTFSIHFTGEQVVFISGILIELKDEVDVLDVSGFNVLIDILGEILHSSLSDLCFHFLHY
ncbi:hypothetical protein TL16_g02496 [Triparma laevis f. inornata]|uniref:Uncharacterized protein n=2 Tax=Triparma laevis TaxID=1534972 RepID=A0A9W7C9G9_9STRA|nr:hypothetical protein TL16_g02496 [Triparma laevis f. inornata]GMI02452.1 hypothetical protein TrLO_g33 [Triparma laevis f. longispina]